MWCWCLSTITKFIAETWDITGMASCQIRYYFRVKLMPFMSSASSESWDATGMASCQIGYHFMTKLIPFVISTSSESWDITGMALHQIGYLVEICLDNLNTVYFSFWYVHFYDLSHPLPPLTLPISSRPPKGPQDDQQPSGGRGDILHPHLGSRKHHPNRHVPHRVPAATGEAK